MDLSVEFVSIDILPVVAGGSDNYNSGINERSSCATKRIVSVGTYRRRAEAHIHDANGVLILIQRIAAAYRLRRVSRADNPVQRAQEDGTATHALRIQDAQVDYAGTGGNALILVSDYGAKSGSGRCHVAAVPKRVVAR